MNQDLKKLILEICKRQPVEPMPNNRLRVNCNLTSIEMTVRRSDRGIFFKMDVCNTLQRSIYCANAMLYKHDALLKAAGIEPEYFEICNDLIEIYNVMVQNLREQRRQKAANDTNSINALNNLRAAWLCELQNNR